MSTCNCKIEVSIHKGHDKPTPENLHTTIKKCFVNGHNCCSTQTCGLLFGELPFEVLDKHGAPNSEVRLTKVHAGGFNECCTAADNYRFKPPQDGDEAALFIAAIQFIDMLFYENPWSCNG